MCIQLIYASNYGNFHSLSYFLIDIINSLFLHLENLKKIILQVFKTNVFKCKFIKCLFLNKNTFKINVN